MASAAVNFIISTIIIVAFCLFSGLGLTPYILYYPIILIIQCIFQLGLAFILSAVTVYFRDLEHFVQIILMLLFYATPIVYSTESIPENIRGIIRLNPMTHIIEGYRHIFYRQIKPDFSELGTVLVFSVLLCIAGYFIFRKLQKGFAEEL